MLKETKSHLSRFVRIFLSSRIHILHNTKAPEMSTVIILYKLIDYIYKNNQLRNLIPCKKNQACIYQASYILISFPK